MVKKKHQDYIYLQSNYYLEPKETFKFNFEKIKERLGDNSDGDGISILDMGCSRGEWLYYVKKFLPQAKLVGVDYSHDLIESAKNFYGLDGVEFHIGSLEDVRLNEKFDFIRIAGVMSYFDDLGPALITMKEHMKKTTHSYIFDQFNPYDVDVIVKYRNNKYSSEFESGWNIASLNTVTKILDDLGLKINSISKFELSFRLKKCQDPARTWMIDTEDGTKFVNGLGQIFDMNLYEITYQV
ncbi:methyltransferase type 11 [Candidatus Magnetobacterium bavaricum]|uniref:Methyltransferase type 11 n=1 Tax=Candidatus Magnetobacterium bavaricum TaxID=29290 RepID=A0A0F3GHH8_9BACT|nr:methyltransferase type 11 [Candidatus Magnetobacterium bavaricum]